MLRNQWKTARSLWVFILLSPTRLSADNSEAIAIRALNEIGSLTSEGTEKCTRCHVPNATLVRQWVDQAIKVTRECKLSLQYRPRTAEDARRQISCLKEESPDNNSFTAKRLGLLSAGIYSDDFRKIFETAYGGAERNWRSEYEKIKSAGMPRGGYRVSDQAWKDLKSWMFFPDTPAPHLERLLASPPPPDREKCVPHISEELKSYLIMRATDSWATRNRDNGMQMFGCDSLSTKPDTCFEQTSVDGIREFPELVSITNPTGRFGNGEHRIVLLSELGITPYFWMRSSPDGRFIANGLFKPRGSGIIDDLKYGKDQNGVSNRRIAIGGGYDPAFFPDNSGFMFQQEHANAGFCDIGKLLDPDTTRISFHGNGCTQQDGVGLYQSLGANLHDADYLAIDGTFMADAMPFYAVQNPDWLVDSFIVVSKMVHNGRFHVVRSSQKMKTPFQGDFQMSPSTKLLVSRVSRRLPNRRVEQNGYIIDRLDISSQRSITMKPLARICTKGAKASFSYDERYLAFYNTVDSNDYEEFGYSNPNDPDFMKLIGTNNIYITDLMTGESKRVTSMPPGQNAKYAHFRSDGWLYFMIRFDEDHYTMAASNAALK